MTPDLRTLLQDAVPEPDRRLDPATVLRRARRRHRTRTAVLAAAAALVVGIAGALVPGPWRHRALLDPAAVPLTVSALADRQPVPPSVAEALASEHAAHPGEATLVGTAGPNKVWLADTVDDRLCLVLAHDGDAWGYGCERRSRLLRTGLFEDDWPDRGDRPGWIVVVAPDGYTTASAAGVRTPFRENTAILALDRAPSSSGALTISGPDLPDVSFPLEFIVGPGPAPAGMEPHVWGARTALADIARSARAYAEEHGGSTQGFAASFPADEVAVFKRQKIEVTDTTASVAVRGHCLSVSLATGSISDRACRPPG